MTSGQEPSDGPSQRPLSLLATRPRLGLLLIAAVFYTTIIGMCMIVLVLIYRSQGA